MLSLKPKVKANSTPNWCPAPPTFHPHERWHCGRPRARFRLGFRALHLHLTKVECTLGKPEVMAVQLPPLNFSLCMQRALLVCLLFGFGLDLLINFFTGFYFWRLWLLGSSTFCSLCGFDSNCLHSTRAALEFSCQPLDFVASATAIWLSAALFHSYGMRTLQEIHKKVSFLLIVRFHKISLISSLN